jgi:nucleotide-binding universal stress UspA family protein
MTAIDMRPTRARHVLLATDIGEASRWATEEAITTAARDDAVLQILAVARLRDDREVLERGIQRVRRRARAAGVRVTSMVWYGDPAEAILEAAWTERPDVLMVGARHDRWLARLRGSVSGKVAREAPCRVEVIPG